jgi:hypothetical protein
MKTLLTAITISIGFVVASIGGTPSVGIVDASIGSSTNQSADIDPKLSTRTYGITPDTFYSSLKHQIAPKDGESDIKLLRRYFQEHHIDLSSPKTQVFVSEKLGKLFVKVTPADQDKVEQLVIHIINSK